MLEFILFKCKRDSKHYKYLSVLKKKEDTLYHYYVIDNYIHFKKRITRNIIRYLSERALISNGRCFISDDLFLDFIYDCYSYDIVYRYKIM